jgi:hypothetical protein
MKKEELVGGLAATYGKEKAREVIDKMIADAGLPVKSDYSKSELLQLCDFMDSSSDRLTRIVGSFVKVKTALLKE